MTPETVTAALTVLDGVIDLVKRLKSESGMTDEQLAAHADAQDLQNKDDIKGLLAL